MRKGKRVLTKTVGLSIFFFLTFLVVANFKEIKSATQQTFSIFTQKEVTPVIEQIKLAPLFHVESNTVTQTATTGSVLAAGPIFWDLYDTSCKKFKGVNGCQIKESSTVVLNTLQFVKEHHGLNIFDGKETKVVLQQEVVDKITYNSKGKPVAHWTTSGGEKSEPFEYCLQPANPESAAMISFGPISWPTTLMGQELSTYRATTGNEEVKYAVIDPTGRLFKDFKVEDILKFCDADDIDRQYALRTIDTYNAKLPGFNQGDQMGYSMLTLCNMTAPDGEKSTTKQREELLKALWEADDVNMKSVASLVEVENNFSGNVDPKFEEEIKKKNIMGVAFSGIPYIGMFGWQTEGAERARIINSTAASKKLLDPFYAPGYSVEEQAEKPDIQPQQNESSTVISANGNVWQREVWKPTVVGAISGGVYYMDESVASDTSNLARLTWNPANQSDDRFFCTIEANKKRCPVIRAIGGCSSKSFAQTDIRLRQITLAAVNDTERYATVYDKDGVERGTNRPEDHFLKMLQSPSTVVDRASIDEILLASQKSSPICLGTAETRRASQVSQLSEEDMAALTLRLSTPDYRDQAVLVTPVRVNYRSWAVYDVDPDAQAACEAWAREHTSGGSGLGATRVNAKDCQSMDPPPKGYNVDMVEKWTPSNYKVKPALISFNIATYYKGLSNFGPTDDRIINFKADLRTQLASQKIFEIPEALVDCGVNSVGELEYWLCRGSSDNTLLPKCQDGTPATDPLADSK